MFWMQFPFVRISLFFMLGIIFAFNYKIDLNVLIFVFLFCSISFLIINSFFKAPRFSSLREATGFLFLCAVFSFGYYYFSYTKIIKKPDAQLYENLEYYAAVVIENSETRGRNFRTIVEVYNIKQNDTWTTASGKVMIYHPVDSAKTSFNYGDILLIKGNPFPIPAPANPEEFNYQEYLQHDNIYLQQFIKPGSIQVIKREALKDVTYFTKALRRYAVNIFGSHIKGSQERAIALALVLGVKNELDPQIKKAYASSGAMHVLAVSGLHVGMIYAVILMIFGRIRKLKGGNILFAIIALCLLWMYAGITGLPASVLRAVTMLSVIILSQIKNRQTNIYNSLAIAAIVLLIYNPMFLFFVGFQLSFLAVTGIVYIFPRLYHLIYPDNKFIDKVWGLCCIAFAAQIATFPLSIYYFHQFPVYFFLSNLVVIPAAFVILSLGLALLVFSFIAEIANVITYILENSIWLVNKIIFMLEFLPYHIIKEIYITSFQTILLYIFLILFALFLNQKSYVALKCSFIAVLCFFIISVLQLKEQFDQQKLVIYNINNHSAIDFINRNNGSSFMSASLLKDSSKIDYHIVPYRLSRGLGQLELLTTKKGSSYETRDGIAFISWNGNKIIILEKPLEDNKVNFSKLETDYLLITNNCYSKLAPVVDRFNFRMLIFDSSNSYGIAQKLEEDARQRNLLFHSTRKAGALIIDF